MSGLRTKLRSLLGLEQIPALGWVFAGQTLITELGFFALFPILGLLLQRTHDLQLAEVALPVTVFTVAVRGGFLFAPLLGRANRLESWLVVSLLATASSFGVLALTRATWLVTLLLATAGLGISLYLTVVRALVAEKVEMSRARTTTFALLNLALNVSASIGPLLGAFLMARALGVTVYGVVAAAYGVGALVMAVIARRARASVRGQAQAEPERSVRWRELFTVLFVNARFRHFSYVNAVGRCLYAQLFATLPLHYVALQGADSSMGAVFTLNAVLVVLFQMPISAAVERRSSAQRRALERWFGAAYLVFALAFLLLGVTSPYLAGIYIAVAVFTLGELVFTPVGHTVVASMGRSGEHLLFFSARGLSDIVGEGVGVYLSIRGLAALQARGHADLYWIGLAVLAASAGFIVLRFYNRERDGLE